MAFTKWVPTGLTAHDDSFFWNLSRESQLLIKSMWLCPASQLRRQLLHVSLQNSIFKRFLLENQHKCSPWCWNLPIAYTRGERSVNRVPSSSIAEGSCSFSQRRCVFSKNKTKKAQTNLLKVSYSVLQGRLLFLVTWCFFLWSGYFYLNQLKLALVINVKRIFVFLEGWVLRFCFIAFS